MARNRQRAKERQAARRAARKTAGQDTRQATDEETRPPPASEDDVSEVVNADLGGAPSPLLGQSGFTLAHTPEAEEFIGDLQIGDEEFVDEDIDEAGTATEEVVPAGPRGVRGVREREEREHREHGRVIGFLVACWAELKRVQWPDRAQLTSLTGVTLLFVLIVGGYLGLLDAVFSKLVQAIL